MLKKTILLGFCLVSLAQAEIISSKKWSTADTEKDFINKQICNKNISSSDCKNNKTNLEKLTGINFNKSPFNDADIQSIELNKVSYSTENEFPATGKVSSTVSGLLMLPETDNPKGVILYYHPTVFNNSSVPSNFDSTNKISSAFNNIYATVYAAQGYIVVAPDYIGQGDDYKNIHPYILYPKQTVNAAIDLLNNVSPTIREKYKLDDSDKLNMYSVGYSEGANYSIWTAKCLESSYNCYGYTNSLDKLYKFRASAGLDGAYSVSDVTLNFMVDNNDSDQYKLQSKLMATLFKPSLAIDAIVSYLYYGGNDSISSNDIDKGFLDMTCSTLPQSKCNVNGENVFLLDIFNKQDLDTDEKIVTAIFNSAMYKKYPEQDSASHYAIPTGNNSLLDLINESLFYNSEYKNALAEANIDDYGSKTRTPLYLFTFKEDSIVTPLNYDKFMANANAIVDGYVLDNNEIISSNVTGLPIKLDMNRVDHHTGEPYANLFAFKYIDDLNKVYR